MAKTSSKLVPPSVPVMFTPFFFNAQVLDAYFGPTGIEYSVGRIPMGSCDFSVEQYSFDDVPGDYNMSYFDDGVEKDTVQRVSRREGGGGGVLLPSLDSGYAGNGARGVEIIPFLPGTGRGGFTSCHCRRRCISSFLRVFFIALSVAIGAFAHITCCWHHVVKGITSQVHVLR